MPSHDNAYLLESPTDCHVTTVAQHRNDHSVKVKPSLNTETRPMYFFLSSFFLVFFRECQASSQCQTIRIKLVPEA